MNCPSSPRDPANACVIRPACANADRAGAYYVCLRTGNAGEDGRALYADDPDASARIYVGPYLDLEPELSLILEDDGGICGYALAALDSRTFYARYDTLLRPKLCAQFPDPAGDPATWSRVQHVYHAYHHPNYFCPEPYALYPSHLHIDLLPHARGRGLGRKMIERLIQLLADRRSTGVHLGAAASNERAIGFYRRLGFAEMLRVGATVYMGQRIERMRSAGSR